MARLLLNKVSRQWNEITAFIDAFLQDLTETAHFPKQKVWLLVGHRVVVSQVEDLETLKSKAKFL